MEFRLMCGDAIEELRKLPDKSINTCVTSPPYYGLRDYGTGTWVGGDPNCPHYRTSKRSDITSTGHASMMDNGYPVGDAIYKTVCPICGAVRVDSQIGLEETPEDYIDRLVSVFREVKRVLRDDGILWVNIGDTYASNGKTGSGGRKKNTNIIEEGRYFDGKRVNHGCKPKDLIGIPWMLAFALRNDGWYLRQDIIWAKNNPMPESVKDRCTRSHEYIFMLTKKRRYWFDREAIQEPVANSSRKNYTCGSGKLSVNMARNDNDLGIRSRHQRYKTRNKRDVWQVSVCSSVKEAHFAVFPGELIEPCILSSCPENGWVLDPFSGSGTSGIVATNNSRNYIGIELNPEYMEITKRRVSKECTNAFIVENGQ